MSKFTPFPQKFPELLDEWDYNKNGDLDPQTLPSGSRLTVWWKCKIQEHPSWQAIIGNRARKINPRGCPYCSGAKVIPSESLAGKYQHLMKDWHPTKNEKLDPFKIHPFGVRRVWWLCNICHHEWNTFVRSRTETDQGCPKCKEKEDAKVSLKALRPDLVEEWNYEKNGELLPEQIKIASNKEVWWTCKICFHVWKTEVKNRTLTTVNSGCPKCSRDEAVLKAKINLFERSEEEDNQDYDYDVEEKLNLQEQKIQDIFRNNLKMEPWDKSIETLLTPRIFDKIDYEPYYQRKYVWDNTKATYLIESILIGTEIPPLIIFDFKGKYEIIDGRQRFETIKRFYHLEFSLTGKGLYLLKFLEKKNYKELDDKLKKLFYSTAIRVIKFSLVNESSIDLKSIDLLKKEIFRRYNSGITPLRRAEIEKAIYIHDEPTKYFKNHFKKNLTQYGILASLFLADSDQDKLDKDITMQKLLQEIRFLLISSEIPISATRNSQTFEEFYNRFSERSSDTIALYRDFLFKIKLLKNIVESLKTKNINTNRYINESIFWGMSVLVKEKKDLKNLNDDNFITSLGQFLKSNDTFYMDDASQFLYKNFLLRYDTFASFIENYFKINLTIYLTNSKRFRKEIKELRHEIEERQVSSIEAVRIEKTQPISKSIDDITKMLLRQEFLVRPAYQRGEVINKQKSSAIIESILLGIPLPPLFIYERDDEILEVVDGQQRLLSILGFIGTEFLDEKGEKVRSEKHRFSLSKLKILEELSNKNYDELEEVLRDRILDFSLSLIVIKHTHNPHFDPVDLFIRLNNRPYPIKENTFEMWNSYVDKDIIDEIKSLTNKYSGWFYLISEQNNKRMKNEELYSILSYLEYKSNYSEFNKSKTYPFIDMFYRESGIFIRVKNKYEVTKCLNKASLDFEEKEKYRRSIKFFENYIKRIRSLLVNKDIVESKENDYLQKELTSIFNVKGSKYYSRKYHDYYALWYSSHFINTEMALEFRKDIKKGIKHFFTLMKTERKSDQIKNALNDFENKLDDFRRNYTKEKRKIFFNREEKKAMIKNQNNICPICNKSIYISDEIEVDHIKRIATKGSDSIDNLQIVHKICNRKKG
jgi:hypothetical protein